MITITNLQNIDSPSLLLFIDKVESNIDKMISIASGDTSRLMPHIKTNKMENVVRMMIAKGITKFKAATIAEAELAAMAGAEKVIIAHQLLGPKIERLLALIEKYPNTKFASLVDCNAVVDEISGKFTVKNLTAEIYYDINNGMDRSGHEIDENLANDLKYAASKSHIKLSGLHVYDGHIRHDAFGERKSKIEAGMLKVYELLELFKHVIGNLEIIAGGTPAFTSHATEMTRTLSPGTCVLWDLGVWR